MISLVGGHPSVAIEKLLAIPEDAFWYLGSPYTKFPYGITAANRVTCKIAARLFSAGVKFFAPIPHSHCIAAHSEVDALDHNGWMKFDAPLMSAAYGLLVLRMPSWQDSIGLKQEISRFAAKGKPIVAIDPCDQDMMP